MRTELNTCTCSMNYMSFPYLHNKSLTYIYRKSESSQNLSVKVELDLV